MSKFAQLDGQDSVVESTINDIIPIEEGWGTAIARVGTYLGIFGTVLAGSLFGVKGVLLGVVGTAAATAANKKIKNISEGQVKKVLTNPKMQKYIITECDRIYSDLKKKYNTKGTSYVFEKKVPISAVEYDESKGIHFQMDLNKDNQKKVLNKLDKHYLFIENIGEYTIGIYADTDHVQGMDALFMLINKETRSHSHIIHMMIPAPTNEELKDLGFIEK